MALRDFADDVFVACGAALEKARRAQHTMPHIVRIAMDLMQKGSWTTVVTDKDGGFCLVKKESFVAELDDIMNGSAYDCKFMGSVAEDLLMEYIILSREVGNDFNDRQLTAALRSDLHNATRSRQQLSLTSLPGRSPSEPSMLHIGPLSNQCTVWWQHG